MIVRGIDYVFYNVSDLKKSLAFYEGVLGLKTLQEPSEAWAEFEVGNLSLAIGVFGEVKPGGASAALAVDSVKKAVAELKKKKVKILQEPMESDPCFMAVIEDPDGNQIIIHERKDGTVG